MLGTAASRSFRDQGPILVGEDLQVLQPANIPTKSHATMNWWYNWCWYTVHHNKCVQQTKFLNIGDLQSLSLWFDRISTKPQTTGAQSFQWANSTSSWEILAILQSWLMTRFRTQSHVRGSHGGCVITKHHKTIPNGMCFDYAYVYLWYYMV